MLLLLVGAPVVDVRVVEFCWGFGESETREPFLLLLLWLVRKLQSESVSMRPLVASNRCTTHIGVAAAFGRNGFSPSYSLLVPLLAQAS